MFGYIKPLTSELKVREFELYKSFYCGLCKTMGKKISALSKITLSYDMVFLVLLRISLTNENIENTAFRCKLKPTTKRNYIKSNESLMYSSCIAAILSYYKYMDDINDTKNKLKKFFIKAFFPAGLFFSNMRKKAFKYYSELDGLIKSSLLKLSELEKNKCKSIDEAASCFAELMKNILSFGLEQPEQIKIAEVIGWHLGRWLYIIDALDDFKKDMKKREYNPFIEYYGNINSLISDIDIIKSSLTSSLNEINTAFSLIDSINNIESSCVNPIILNIINLGLCRQQEIILNKLNNANL